MLALPSPLTFILLSHAERLQRRLGADLQLAHQHLSLADGWKSAAQLFVAQQQVGTGDNHDGILTCQSTPEDTRECTTRHSLKTPSVHGELSGGIIGDEVVIIDVMDDRDLVRLS